MIDARLDYSRELSQSAPRARESRQGLRCPLCEGEFLERRHCKLVCLSCGYVESCEDNFLPNQANPRE